MILSNEHPSQSLENPPENGYKKSMIKELDALNSIE